MAGGSVTWVVLTAILTFFGLSCFRLKQTETTLFCECLIKYFTTFFLAHGACPLVPTGAVPNGDGATFPAIFAKQQLGFHECDSPLVDGEFPEGAKCGKISCHGASNHISQSDVVCSNGNWMQQDDTRVSGVPNCPRGCLASENTWTISRCRKNFMDGVESYEDGDETYFWPGQRCKKVQCSAIRKPRHGAKNDTKKFWKV